jgi:RNA recognition motif-containing protein
MGDVEVTKLYIANLPPAITEEQMRDLLSDFEDVGEIEITETLSPDEQPISGVYLALENEDTASKVSDRFNGYELMGRRLSISPASPPKELAAPTQEERDVAEQIADKLQESDGNARRQILDIVRFGGISFAESLFEEAQMIESSGGMLIPNSDQRRTIGGIFFKLTKSRMSSKIRWFVFRPPERKKSKPKEQKEQQSAPKKEKSAKKEKAPKKQPPAPAPESSQSEPAREPALSPEEAQQKVAELQTALQTAQEHLAALKSGPATKQAGLFSAMKQVVELQRQLDNLLKAHPDLR